MVDTSLHRQGVALYRALVKLTPEGADRLETNLHEIVTKGGAGRAFTIDGEVNENAVKQAWRYLVSIGSVQNLGPRFKRAVREPDEAAADGAAAPAPRAKRAGPAKKAARKSTRTTTKRAAKKAGATRRARTGARTTTARRSASTRSNAARSNASRSASTRSNAARSNAARSNGTASGAIADAIPAPSMLAGQLTGFQAQLEDSLTTLERLRQQINDTYEQLARLEDEHNAVVRDLLAFREALGDTNQRSYVDSIVGDNLWSYAPRS
jgi:hypothetical protein